jgi:RNA-directed DNA polymerase
MMPRFKRWRNNRERQLPDSLLYAEYGLVNLIRLIPSLASRQL